jgi:hypothetical protein
MKQTEIIRANKRGKQDATRIKTAAVTGVLYARNKAIAAASFVKDTGVSIVDGFVTTGELAVVTAKAVSEHVVAPRAKRSWAYAKGFASALVAQEPSRSPKS